LKHFALIDINRIKGWFLRKRTERLIKRAKKLHELTGYKYMVVFAAGRLTVVSKRTIKEMIKRKVFSKGTTVQDIEKKAIYIT